MRAIKLFCITLSTMFVLLVTISAKPIKPTVPSEPCPAEECTIVRNGAEVFI